MMRVNNLRTFYVISPAHNPANDQPVFSSLLDIPSFFLFCQITRPKPQINMRAQAFTATFLALSTAIIAAPPPPKTPTDQNLVLWPARIYFPGAVSDYIVSKAAWAIEDCPENYVKNYTNFPAGNGTCTIFPPTG